MPDPSDTHLARPGKYLSFLLGDESYAIDILRVQEIIGMINVTRVPKTPDYVRGVINLRGKVIPVLELRRKFEMASVPDTRRTCIIVVQMQYEGQALVIGLVVDAVAEVTELPADALQPPPTLGRAVDTRLLTGMGKQGDRVLMLLDVDRLFTYQDLAAVQAGA